MSSALNLYPLLLSQLATVQLATHICPVTAGSNTNKMDIVKFSLCLLPMALVYGATVVIYRLCFHSLSRFPGPKLAAATELYEIYFDIFKGPGGQFANHLEKLHKIYGIY